ncbi:MAG: IS66 family transposase [Mesoflavibacter sp.]|nr:IS66 family transposase [Mesoflavibacter sp.]
MDKDKIILELIAKVDSLIRRVQQLEHFEAENKKLRIEINYLKARLSKYETPKNSNNSSIAPSQDENRPRRNQSLREKTGRSPGGQKGRKGNTLKMIETPNIIQKHKPDFCSCCGKDISNFACEFVGKRQIIDLPEIKFHVHEHQIFKKVCSCGHQTTGQYPSGANAPVSYGNNLESLIGYLHARQYIPFKRIEEFIKDVFNIPISEGGIHYLLNKLVTKAKPAYELIREKLKSSNGFAIGTDETGVKVSGDKHWAWTWQNNEATFISITDNRSGKSITENFKDGFEKSVLVHDCWKSHFNTKALTHQICIAHLLRELNYLSERYHHKWSKLCKMLLLSAIKLKKQMSKADYYVHNPRRENFENRLNILLNYTLNENDKELITFRNRLIKYQDYIFSFLYRHEVPPDNNASERAIRNIKVKQKISGQFKSPDGAFGFAVLRSITDTIIKNNQNVLKSLKVIANLYTD